MFFENDYMRVNLSSLAASVLLLMTSHADAADYYVIVPVKGKTENVSAIQVGLNSYTLPSGFVNKAYSGFDFKTLVQVTGDSRLNLNYAKFTLAGGSLPAGLSLSSDGKLFGTPAAGGTSTFSVRVAYKTKTVEQAYNIVSAELVVSLAEMTLPSAAAGTAYVYDLKTLLSSNDPGFKPADAQFSVAGLPSWLTATGGVLSGTPSLTSGDVTLNVTVSYKTATDARSYMLPVKISMANPTWSPGSFGGAGSASYSSGNLRVTFTAGLNGVAPTVPLPTTGKWYWETEYHTGSAAYTGIGTIPITSHVGNGTYGQTYSCGVDMDATTAGLMAASTGAWKTAVFATPVSPLIGHAYNADTRTVSFYRGGVYMGQCGVYGTQTLYARVGNSASASGGTSYTLKMHPSQMMYSPPEGYRAGVPQP